MKKLRIAAPREYIIELTSACNYSCAMCAVSLPTYHPKTLPRDRVFQLIYEIASTGTPVSHIQLSGHGESTILPWFGDLIKHIRKVLPRERTTIGFHTNGSRLDRLAQLLVEYRVNTVAVSIDGGSREVFDEVRGEGSFEKLNAGLSALAREKTKQRTSVPNIEFVSILTRNTVFETDKIVEIVDKYGGCKLTLQPLVSYSGLDTEKWALSNLNDDERKRAREIVENAKHIAFQAGIGFEILNVDIFNEPQPEWHISPSVYDKELIELDEGKKKKYRDCSDPWTKFFIASSGHINTCCHRFHDVKETLETHSLNDIWFGSTELNTVRKNLLTGNLDQICGKCAVRPLSTKPPRIDV